MAASDALRGVSPTVWRGEIRALGGENGAGKSTLAKALAGEIFLHAGLIVLDGPSGVVLPRIWPPADRLGRSLLSTRSSITF